MKLAKHGGENNNTSNTNSSSLFEQMFLGDRNILENILDMAGVAIWVWDIQNDQLYGTSMMYQLFGVEQGTFGGSLYKAMEAVTHPDYKEYAFEYIEEMATSNEAKRFKFCAVTPAGKERWLLVSGKFSDETNHAMGIMLDVTEGQKKEIKLFEDLIFLQGFIEAVPMPLFYKTDQEIYAFCNTAFAALMGTHKENIIGKTLEDLAPKDLADEYRKKNETLLANGISQEYDFVVQLRDAERGMFRFAKGIQKSGHSQSVGIAGAMINISDIVIENRQVKRKNKLREAMLEVSHSVIGMHDSKNLLAMLLDKALEIIECADVGAVLEVIPNDYMRLLTARGYQESQAEFFFLKIEETFPHRKYRKRIEIPQIINDLEDLVDKGAPKAVETVVGETIRSSIATPIYLDGEYVALINVDSFSNNVFNEDDLELMQYFKTQAELALTNLKLYEETVMLSRIDQVTGVYTRGYFEKIFEEFLSRTVDLTKTFTFVVLDLDRLREVNETSGHKEGDRYIKEFAFNIQSVLGEEDLLGRFGGDEFVAVFFDEIAENVEKKLTELQQHLEHLCSSCAFNFGMSQYPEDGTTYENLVKVSYQRLWAKERMLN